MRNKRRNDNYLSRKKKKSLSECQAEARIENLKIYKKWNLKKKYHFALPGYEFSNNPGQKAIVLDKTDMIADALGQEQPSMNYQKTL